MISTPRLVPLLVCFSLAPMTLVACGGGDSVPAKSPDRPKEAESEPHTVEEAEEQIARARADLGGTRPSTESSKTDHDSVNDARPPPPPPSPAPQAGTAREERAAASDSCGSPCRALASMRRAVDALCRMTGDQDPRCVDAKKTLSDSTTRLSTCKCETR